MNSKKLAGVGAGMPDVLEQLKSLGVAQVPAQMAIPYMWFTPGSSDPYSPVVIVIVRGLQTGLARLGIQTRGDGFVDEQTAAALVRIAGRNWKGKAWVQIYGDVITALRTGSVPGEETMHGSLGHYGARGYYGSLGHYGGWGSSYGSLGQDSANHVVRSGVCKPIKGPAGDVKLFLRQFEDLQRQINRLNFLAGNKLIREDGDIGPLTVSSGASAAAFMASKGSPLSWPSTCSEIAAGAPGLAALMRGTADALGAPAKPSGIPSSIVSIKTVINPATGKEEAVPLSIPGLGDMSMLTLGAVIVGGLLLWKATSKKKKRKAPAKRRRRRRTPRTRTTITRYR